MEVDSTIEKYFPLEDVSGVVKLFKGQLEEGRDPDLALLSIVVGAVENQLTCNRNNAADDNESEIFDNFKLPTIEYRIVNALYTKFHSTIKGYVDLSLYGDTKYATSELVHRVSDVIWNSLARSYYKDRAHLQSLYSYLAGNKLDCFGVTFAVVAACQALGFHDVHLALSEDHSWVTFGENGSETAEVTWHGKGEDKRGQPVDSGIASQCWLYLNGCPVKCNRQMEVAALVSAINPSLNMTSDAVEVALLQQQLLWLLYDKGHLSHYPMAIGNLADLEEINPTAGRPLCSLLFQEAIFISRMCYSNTHVYPYTYQGGYFYRHNMYKEAFESWANVGDVLKQYNYTRDDEEIYKEVMEIANELIPHIMKVVSSGHSARSILKDPECFAYLLRFYDGICQWEEGSQTPVLHIGWAKPLVNTISKFDSDVRSKVVIMEQDFIENGGGDENCNIKTTVADSKENPPKNFRNGTTGKDAPEDLHPGIKELTAACGEKILNRDFLIQGGGEPFVGNSSAAVEDSASSAAAIDDVEPPDLLQTVSAHPRIILYSEKMRGLKHLLLNEKLNTHAISLQLTAQSQVQIGGKRFFNKENDTNTNVGPCVRSKRSRRE